MIERSETDVEVAFAQDELAVHPRGPAVARDHAWTETVRLWKIKMVDDVRMLKVAKAVRLALK